MGARDYMPTKDESFDVFQSNFIASVQPNLITWSIPTTEFTPLTTLQTAWNTAWNKAKNKDTRSRADVQAKKEARKAFQLGHNFSNLSVR